MYSSESFAKFSASPQKPLTEIERSQKLNDLLDAEKINQVVILAKSVQRASAPKKKMLVKVNFLSVAIRSASTRRTASATATWRVFHVAEQQVS